MNAGSISKRLTRLLWVLQVISTILTCNVVSSKQYTTRCAYIGSLIRIGKCSLFLNICFTAHRKQWADIRVEQTYKISECMKLR